MQEARREMLGKQRQEAVRAFDRAEPLGALAGAHGHGRVAVRRCRFKIAPAGGEGGGTRLGRKSSCWASRSVLRRNDIMAAARPDITATAQRAHSHAGHRTGPAPSAPREVTLGQGADA